MSDQILGPIIAGVMLLSGVLLSTYMLDNAKKKLDNMTDEERDKFLSSVT